MEVTFLWKLSHWQLKNMLDSLYLYSCLLALLIMFIRESVSTSGMNLMFILFSPKHIAESAWINHRNFMLGPSVIQRHLTLDFCCLLNAYNLKSFAALLVAFMHLFFPQNTSTKGRLCARVSAHLVTSHMTIHTLDINIVGDFHRNVCISYKISYIYIYILITWLVHSQKNYLISW